MSAAFAQAVQQLLEQGRGLHDSIDRQTCNEQQSLCIGAGLVVMHQATKIGVDHDAVAELAPALVARKIIGCVHAGNDIPTVLRIDLDKIAGF